MNNPRKLALVVAAITVLGLGGLIWTSSVGQASKAQGHDDQGADSHGHAEEAGEA